MKFLDRVKGYFNSHPTTNEFHVTSDGQAFFKKVDAEAHGQSLSDKTIESYTRTEAFLEGEEEPGTESQADYSAMTVAQLKEALTNLEVSFEPKATKAMLIALLLEHDPTGTGSI